MSIFYKEYSGYVIKNCDDTDIHKFMKFIDEYWKKGHILSRDKEFIRWQYYDRVKKGYNILIAISNGDVVGTFSFIQNKFFDNTITDEETYTWLTLWKIKETNLPNVGLNLIYAIFNIAGNNNIGCVGINDSVEKIYKMLKFKTGTLEHYYLINNRIKNYNLISGFIKSSTKKETGESNILEYTYLEESTLDTFVKKIDSNMKIMPKKTGKYFINKYINNKFYEYKAIGLKKGSNPIGLIIFRKDVFENANAIRIIDIYGDFKSLIGLDKIFEQLMIDNDSEYTDIYCYDTRGDLERLNFNKIKNNDGIIIPNYFNPFEKRNVDIRFAYKVDLNDSTFMIFKGDGDQDRPS